MATATEVAALVVEEGTAPVEVATVTAVAVAALGEIASHLTHLSMQATARLATARLATAAAMAATMAEGAAPQGVSGVVPGGTALAATVVPAAAAAAALAAAALAAAAAGMLLPLPSTGPLVEATPNTPTYLCGYSGLGLAIGEGGGSEAGGSGGNSPRV